MKFRLYPPTYLESNADVVLPPIQQADDGARLFVAGDDPLVVNALYSHMSSNIDLNRNVTNDDFNEALRAALNTDNHHVKKCNLAVAVFNGGGCFVAQMGRTRVLQYRPASKEWIYDSMYQVLDIYSSKAKVEQLRDFEAGDFVILSTADHFEPREFKKILSNDSTDDNVKAHEIAEVMKAVKTEAGNRPSLVVIHVETCSGACRGQSIMRHVRPKHVLYLLLACVIAGLLTWLVAANPFANLIKQAPDTVNPDSLVTTKAPHLADTTFIAPAIDTLALRAEQDSIRNAQIRQAHVLDSLKKVAAAKKAAKAQAETEAALNRYEIKEIHSEPQNTPVEAVTPEPSAEEGV